MSALWDNKLNFSNSDYFKQSFFTNPTKQGIGGHIHDCIIANKEKYGINNVYSTNTDADGYQFTEDVNTFWRNRVINNKAVFDNTKNRYKILF